MAMKKVNLTEIAEAMQSLGFTASFSAGKVTFQNPGVILQYPIVVKDTDSLIDFLENFRDFVTEL